MKDDPFHWSNPLEVPLPNAPEMTIYCLYGVGKTTERFYFYNSQTPEGFPTIDTKSSFFLYIMFTSLDYLIPAPK